MPAQAHGLAADPDATIPNAVAAAAPPGPPASPVPPAATMPPPPSMPPVGKPSQSVAIAVVAGIAVVGIGALLATWLLWPRGTSGIVAEPATQQRAPAAASATPPGSGAPAANAAVATAPAVANVAAGPAVANVAAKAAAAAEAPPPGNLVIAAVGLADPSDPRYASDKTLLQKDVREDSKQQLIEKALLMLLDRQSFATNYDVLKDRVVSRSGDFISGVVREGEPQMGKDGLMSVTTQAIVDVRAVQQTLNRLSRDERVTLIRANGDPRVAVRISLRDADAPDAPAQPSPIAENILKERIKSFGFRTWSDEAASGDNRGADFLVTGEVVVKRLTTRLAASGLVITKYALSSWTIKATNRLTGEEIHFSTTLPKGLGSWPTEEEALRAIGAKVADQFSRDLFLQHVNVAGRKITMAVTGMPDAMTDDQLVHELLGLPAVIAAQAGPAGASRTYELQVAQSEAAGDAIARDVAAPLNAKLGQPCFTVGAVDGSRVGVAFDPQCADGMLRGRLETNPPAGLYGAPPARQKSIIKNPDTLRKLA
jgi:serine/threonine-protein kinase